MRIAKFSHENGFKVHYYIPPKAWAWNSGRAIKLKKKYVEKIYSTTLKLIFSENIIVILSM